ncbi:MAG TPA: class I SAM-dependent methyltransferase [Armatimonadota bacterium]|nr:class I SAM-dependent methyltransferase [Armatimonadota bacterium]
MTSSKPWDWAHADQRLWQEPSEDVYYYLHRWRTSGKTRVLDLGCGIGRHALLFAAHGFDVDALDLSPVGVETVQRLARERGLAVRAQVGDALQLPYADAAFDAVLAYHVISHTDSQGIVTIVTELLRVLAPGGEFFVTLCSKASPAYRQVGDPIVDENTTLKMQDPEIGVPHYYTDTAGVRDLFQGCEIIRLRHVEDIFDTFTSYHYFVHGQKRRSEEGETP